MWFANSTSAHVSRAFSQQTNGNCFSVILAPVMPRFVLNLVVCPFAASTVPTLQFVVGA